MILPVDEDSLVIPPFSVGFKTNTWTRGPMSHFHSLMCFTPGENKKSKPVKTGIGRSELDLKNPSLVLIWWNRHAESVLSCSVLLKVKEQNKTVRQISGGKKSSQYCKGEGGE